MLSWFVQRVVEIMQPTPVPNTAIDALAKSAVVTPALTKDCYCLDAMSAKGTNIPNCGL